MLLPYKDYDLICFYKPQDSIHNGIDKDKVQVKRKPHFLMPD